MANAFDLGLVGLVQFVPTIADGSDRPRARARDRHPVTLADLKARADARRVFVEKEDPSPGDDESD
jgi:hypothetical protein